MVQTETSATPTRHLLYVVTLESAESQSDSVRALAESDSVAKPCDSCHHSCHSCHHSCHSCHHTCHSCDSCHHSCQHSGWLAGGNTGASDMTLSPGGIKCLLILPLTSKQTKFLIEIVPKKIYDDQVSEKIHSKAGALRILWWKYLYGQVLQKMCKMVICEALPLWYFLWHLEHDN